MLCVLLRLLVSRSPTKLYVGLSSWNDNPGNWFTNAQAALDSGSTHLLGFNEPDLVGQADMTIPETVQAWKTYMSPFYGKAKLVSPAVTNGGFPMGRDYLKHFFGNCTVCYEQTSAVALHCTLQDQTPSALTVAMTFVSLPL